jgi:hypothetical protein
MSDDFIFDEAKYPVAWRLNSEGCRLSIDDKNKVVFLNEMESERLWDVIFPFYILMEISKSHCHILERKELDFDEIEESAAFFEDKLKDTSELFFFWGRRAAAILPGDIMIKAWDDFFTPVMNQVLFTFLIKEK